MDALNELLCCSPLVDTWIRILIPTVLLMLVLAFPEAVDCLVSGRTLTALMENPHQGADENS